MRERLGHYQIVMLGAVEAHKNSFQPVLFRRVKELGLDPSCLRFFEESNAPDRDRRSPVMAVFFGSASHRTEYPSISLLLEDSVVIAPLVSSMQNVHAEIPEQLRHINALEFGEGSAGLERLSTLILETFKLLRRERRLFISYRRKDAQPFAERLYDELDACGFDVFIDVRSVPPAVDFQSELWHRMSDSDVVVLIDTPGFREGRWTTEELAKANATNIQILHLLWPGQREDGSSSFSHFFRLRRSDFMALWIGRGKFARKSTFARICNETERLRARAIAARHRYLIDNFCDAARDLGMRPVVQPELWISLDVDAGKKKLAIVPAVGVPKSDRINEVFDAVSEWTADPRDVWIIYDNRGVLNTWLGHLDWLDQYLPIRTIRMAKAPELLRQLFA